MLLGRWDLSDARCRSGVGASTVGQRSGADGSKSESSSRASASYPCVRKTSPTSPAALDILCFSETRSDLAQGARLQELLGRARSGGARVLVIEPPVWRSGPARLETTSLADGTCVAVPHLPAGLPGYLGKGTVRRLAHEAVARVGLGPYLLWCATPLAASFDKLLAPSLVVYDRAGDPTSAGCAERTGRDHDLMARADLVLVRSNADLDAALRTRSDSQVVEDASNPAGWDERWTAVARLIEDAQQPRLAPAA